MNNAPRHIEFDNIQLVARQKSWLERAKKIDELIVRASPEKLSLGLMETLVTLRTDLGNLFCIRSDYSDVHAYFHGIIDRCKARLLEKNQQKILDQLIRNI